MIQWAAGLAAASATAIVFSFVRWRFKGRAGTGISMALTLAMLFTATTVVTPQVASAFTVQSSHVGSHVTTTPNLNCSYVAESERMDNQGNPRIDTTATIDWGPHCSWTTYTAAADRILVREDLESYNSNGGYYYACNSGPWITGNGTYFTHQISTGWTFYTPCGDPGWYRQIGYSGFLTGVGWQWGSMDNAWMYQTP